MEVGRGFPSPLVGEGGAQRRMRGITASGHSRKALMAFLLAPAPPELVLIGKKPLTRPSGPLSHKGRGETDAPT